MCSFLFAYALTDEAYLAYKNAATLSFTVARQATVHLSVAIRNDATGGPPPLFVFPMKHVTIIKRARAIDILIILQQAGGP